jgi:hypothetical protein
MNTRRRSPAWILPSIGAFAVAGFLLGGVSIFLNTASLAAISHLRTATPSIIAPEPLRWNQIESADREAYVANLREIGCPEPTIAAIVDAPESNSNPDAAPVANIRSVVATVNRSQPPESLNGVNATISAPQIIANAGAAASAPTSSAQAEDGPSSIGETSTNAPSRRSVSAFSPPAAQGSPGGRSASSAGSGPQTGLDDQAGVASNDGSTAAEQVIVAPNDNVLIPAAFQPAGPNVQLNDQEKAQQEALQRDFANAVQKDPSTPVSPEAWQMAQEKSDEQFRMLFGYQAFLRRQIQANLHQQSGAD